VVLYTSAYDQENCFPEICRAFTIKEVGLAGSLCFADLCLSVDILIC